MTLSFPDYIVIALYFGLILYIGFIVSHKRQGKSTSYEEFILAGRGVTLPIFVATLVATWYGSILGIGEFVYRDGFVAWICFGLPYYIVAALFAAFIAKRIRIMAVNTIPEQISKNYGSKAGLVSSAIILIITIPASYILMLGVLIQLFTGWSLIICIFLGALFSLAYLFTGGFRADIFTNAAQFVIMYLGFIVLLIFSIIRFGWFDVLPAHLPESHLTAFGPYSWQFILSWYIIAFQTFIDPSFHQRCSAAATPKIAQHGVFISILCWAVFDFLTLMTGLYARAFFVIDNPMMAYPVLADAILPAVWKGILVVAMLAVVMSTLDSYAFISAATIGNDILGRFRFIRIRNINPRILIKIGLVITSILSIFIAAAISSVVQIIYVTCSITVPALLFPLVLTYSSKYKITTAQAVSIMIAASAGAGLWTLCRSMIGWDWIPQIDIIMNIEPMMIGIVISIIVGFLSIKKIKILE
jgi:solute:Na+ symporter, SSS family